MRISIVIPNYYIACIIATACKHDGNTCTIFSTLFDFFAATENENQRPDLAVVDYLTFDHNVFNIYRYMKSKNTFIPTIFYNDPFPPAGLRHNHWETTLGIIYPEWFNAEQYKSIFKLIASIVESELLRPYIPLLQPARPEPVFQFESPKKFILANGAETENIGKHFKLSGTLFLLFDMLYKNRNTAISTTYIKNALTRVGSPVKTNTIYALIKRLREKLTKSQDVHADIITTTGGYRLLFIEKREKEA